MHVGLGLLLTSVSYVHAALSTLLCQVVAATKWELSCDV